MTIITIVVMGLFAFSCNKAEEEDDVNTPKTTSSKTIIVYMVCENSLYSYMTTGKDGLPSDINEILSGVKYIGETDNIILYLDGIKNPAIYKIDKDTKATSFTTLTPLYTYTNDHNSCDPAIFSQVLKFTYQNFPSEKYGLIMASHGSGWITPQARRSFGIDNGKNNQTDSGDEMSIEEIDSVCKVQMVYNGGKKFEFILFDACFMQNIETAYTLKDISDYIIASPAEIPAPGAPYTEMLEKIFSNNFHPKDIIDSYYDYYKTNPQFGIVLSMIETAKLDQFAEKTSEYITKYKSQLLNQQYDTVLNYFDYDKYKIYGDYPDFYDMKSVMQSTLTPDDYTTWIKEFNNVVPDACFTNWWFSIFNGNNDINEEQCGGVTMHIPLSKYKDDNMWFADKFYNNAWAKRVWNIQNQ